MVFTVHRGKPSKGICHVRLIFALVRQDTVMCPAFSIELMYVCPSKMLLRLLLLLFFLWFVVRVCALFVVFVVVLLLCLFLVYLFFFCWFLVVFLVFASVVC